MSSQIYNRDLTLGKILLHFSPDFVANFELINRYTKILWKRLWWVQLQQGHTLKNKSFLQFNLKGTVLQIWELFACVMFNALRHAINSLIETLLDWEYMKPST